MIATSDSKGSDVRIYCYNDSAGQGKRWAPLPDLQGAAKKSKNSKKPFELQTWWDSGNQIFRGIRAKGCQDPDVETLGQTYKFKDLKYTDNDQNPNRESIADVERFDHSVCSLILYRYVISPSRLGQPCWTIFPFRKMSRTPQIQIQQTLMTWARCWVSHSFTRQGKLSQYFITMILTIVMIVMSLDQSCQ